MNKKNRISKLPDTLLHHILTTYLDSSDRKQTWVLSKRWVNFWTTCKVDAAFRSDDSLRLCHKDFVAFPCVDSSCLKELVLTDCVNVNLMDWTLPSLTYLYLNNVKFGNQISGFDMLKKLTVAGFTHDIFTINCPNLRFLTLVPDFSRCTLVVSAPNLSIFTFCSTDYVPAGFSPGVVFPCIREAHIDIEIKDSDWASYDSYMIDLTMHNIINMLNAVRGTQWLWLSRQTIQVLRRITDLSAYQPPPLNLEFLYLLGIHEKPTRSTDPVIDYLLSTSPSAKIFHGNKDPQLCLNNRI